MPRGRAGGVGPLLRGTATRRVVNRGLTAPLAVGHSPFLSRAPSMCKTYATFAALCALALVPAVTEGRRALPPPTVLRAAVADALVVGKVTEVADKAETVELSKGYTREMKVATVKVESAISGKPGKTIKVGAL